MDMSAAYFHVHVPIYSRAWRRWFMEIDLQMCFWEASEGFFFLLYGWPCFPCSFTRACIAPNTYMHRHSPLIVPYIAYQ